MKPVEEFDPVQNKPEEPRPAPGAKKPRREDGNESRPLTFLRGLQTTLAAAFVVATLFTLWTPGSLVEGSLEVRMAQVLQSAPGEATAEALVKATQDPAATNIGIVAGHYGYNDPGAVCADGLTEAEVNLEIATLVQKSLTDMGYQVDLLEEFDDRLDDYKGSALISIHLDSCDYINDQATGFKVAAALSEENQIASQKLTTCLSEQYADVTDLPYHAGSVTDDMTYYHAFSEIDPQTTAAIIEAGFMNMDYSFITEQTDRVAEGIVAGILCFLNN